MKSAKHRMRTAFPSFATAKRIGLNKNHHLRVWCDCQNDPVLTPGTFSERPRHVVEADPRRLGAWDSLGFVDSRVPNSALELWKEHVAQCESA